MDGYASPEEAMRADGATFTDYRPPPDDGLDGLVNPADLQGIEPPEREWVVEGWLPVGTVTSLYGGGGNGKSLLGQQLQVATALGRPFLGLPTERCRSLGFFCEDDDDELHRRARAICGMYGARMADLGAVRWQGRLGKPNIMATAPGGLLKPAPFLHAARRAVEAHRPRLLILDNIAQLWGGSEVDRGQVTQFVNALAAIAREFRCAVLLLGHPSKTEGSEYSGTTAWDACVRSRWVLERPKAGLGDEDEPPAELRDLRVLRKAKANYAGTGDEIPLRWVEGAFRVEGAAALQTAEERAERHALDTADDRAFLECLDALAEQGRHVSPAKSSTSYAVKAMHGQPQTKGMSGKRLLAAMERLFQRGAIVVGEVHDKWRRPTRAIVRKASGPEAGDYGRHRQ